MFISFYLTVSIRQFLSVCIALLYFITDVPNVVMNVTISEADTTGESFVVLWDEVMDIFTITYIVTWYYENDIVGMVIVNSPPYTVTGLTVNTSYNVTVVANNTCCGPGPVSNVVMAMTNMRKPIRPPSLIPTSSSLTTTPSPMPNDGNLILSVTNTTITI